MTATATSTTNAHSTSRLWMPRLRARDGLMPDSSSELYITAHSAMPATSAINR